MQQVRSLVWVLLATVARKDTVSIVQNADKLAQYKKIKNTKFIIRLDMYIIIRNVRHMIVRARLIRDGQMLHMIYNAIEKMAS